MTKGLVYKEDSILYMNVLTTKPTEVRDITRLH